MAADENMSSGCRTRSSGEWFKEGPPLTFTGVEYVELENWNEQVAEAEGLSKADRMLSFKRLCAEFQTLEDTRVGPALQSGDDLTELCQEHQQLGAQVLLYCALVEFTEAVTRAQNQVKASSEKLRAAYQKQQQSEHEQSFHSMKLTPSRLEREDGGGIEMAGPLPNFQRILSSAEAASAKADDKTLEPEEEKKGSELEEKVAMLMSELEKAQTDNQRLKSQFKAAEQVAVETKKMQEQNTLRLQQELEKKTEITNKLLNDLKAREERNDKKLAEVEAQLEKQTQQNLIYKEKLLRGYQTKHEAEGWDFEPVQTMVNWENNKMVKRVMEDLKALLEPEDNEEYEPNTDLVALVQQFVQHEGEAELEDVQAELCLTRFGKERINAVQKLWRTHASQLKPSHHLFRLAKKIAEALVYFSGLVHGLNKDATSESGSDRTVRSEPVQHPVHPDAAFKARFGTGYTGQGREVNKTVSYLENSGGNTTWLRNIVQATQPIHGQAAKEEVFKPRFLGSQAAKPTGEDRAFGYMKKLAGTNTFHMNPAHFPALQPRTQAVQEEKGYEVDGDEVEYLGTYPESKKTMLSRRGAKGPPNHPPFGAASTPKSGGNPGLENSGGGDGPPSGPPRGGGSPAEMLEAGAASNATEGHPDAALMKALEIIMMQQNKGSEQHPKMTLKHDKIKIPVYSGKEEDFAFWFRDFYELVVDRQDLKDWEKKHLLKNHLSKNIQDSIYGGRADSLTLEECLQALINRYAQPDKVMATIRRELKNLTPPKDIYDADGLFKMVQTTRKHISALTIYGTDMQQINFIAVDGIMDKLTPDVIHSLAQTGLHRNSKPLRAHNIGELLTLMEEYALVCNDLKLNQGKPKQAKGNDKKETKTKPAEDKPRTTLVTEQKKGKQAKENGESYCVLCQKYTDHYGSTCQKFATPDERMKQFVDAKLCYTCAKPLSDDNHQGEKCATKTCRIQTDGVTCGKAHHYLLHRYLQANNWKFPSKTQAAGGPQPQSKKKQKSGSGSGGNSEAAQGNGERPR